MFVRVLDEVLEVSELLIRHFVEESRLLLRVGLGCLVGVFEGANLDSDRILRPVKALTEVVSLRRLITGCRRLHFLEALEMETCELGELFLCGSLNDLHQKASTWA